MHGCTIGRTSANLVGTRSLTVTQRQVATLTGMSKEAIVSTISIW